MLLRYENGTVRLVEWHWTHLARFLVFYIEYQVEKPIVHLAWPRLVGCCIFASQLWPTDFLASPTLRAAGRYALGVYMLGATSELGIFEGILSPSRLGH